MDLVDWINLF